MNALKTVIRLMEVFRHLPSVVTEVRVYADAVLEEFWDDRLTRSYHFTSRIPA